MPSLMMLLVVFVYLCIRVSAGNNSSYCNRIWPSLDLFLPIHLKENSKRNNEFIDFFLRSLLLFWPLEVSQTTLRLVIDSELRDSPLVQTANNKLMALAAGRIKNISYTFLEESPFYHGEGYHRQQLAMFWADNFTSSEYVGFVDSDTLFVSTIDREDLFENGKPVVNARIGYDNRKPWKDMPRSTYTITVSLLPLFWIPLIVPNLFPNNIFTFVLYRI